MDLLSSGKTNEKTSDKESDHWLETFDRSISNKRIYCYTNIQRFEMLEIIQQILNTSIHVIPIQIYLHSSQRLFLQMLEVFQIRETAAGRY
jgi:hypothetical protein